MKTELEQQFEMNQKSWNQLGEVQPYWSVSTIERYKKEKITSQEIEIFYQDGKKVIDKLKNIAEYYQLQFQGKHCLEFGCGVGRLAFSLREYFDEVTGTDISEPHLNIAINRAKSKKIGNVHFTKNGHDLNNLENKLFDYIVSYVVLQHLTPPLMEHYISKLTTLLAQEGIAMLYLPVGHSEYRWDERKLEISLARGGMQMHCLPYERVEQAVQQGGGKILHYVDRQPDGRPWEIGYESGVFIIKHGT